MASQASSRLRVISNQLTADRSIQDRQCAGSSGSFRYTLDNPVLTTAQRQFYEDNGYLVIKNLVGSDKLEQYTEQFQKICSGEINVPRLTIMRDVAIAKSEFVAGEKTVTKIQNFQYYEPLFDYCIRPEILEYVECFCGPDIMVISTMLINKPPDPGTQTSRHPLHQDLNYFPFRPADRIVCSWTAMEKAHRPNGCLVVIPGTHKSELKQHVYPKWEKGVNHLYLGIHDFDPSVPMVHLEMEKGDTVFFHPLLIHGSGTNRTQGFRKAISGHYASSASRFVNLEELESPEAAHMMAKRASRVVGKQVSVQDMWKHRARVAKGRNVKFSG